MKLLIPILILLAALVPGKTLAAKKVLIVVTNHSELGNTGKKTGYFLSEVSHPYYKIIEAGHEVSFASPKGGYAPMDPKSLDLKDPQNKKFFENKKLMRQLSETIPLKNIKAKNYQAILFAGGHGTMWDFPNSKVLSNLTAKLYESGSIVAAVCHGPAALVNIKLSNGKYLIKGKRLTGFTNKEEDIVDLSSQMPFMLETKLVKRGAKFESTAPWKEKVVVDGRLVTGQNPSSASELGSKIVKLLK